MGKKNPEGVETQHTSRLSQSGIPVYTPRKPHSGLPSAFTTPQLGLVPPTRRLSVSGSPINLSPGSPSSSTNGGLTPFRSFRNLFSTGSGLSKIPPSPSNPDVSKRSFPTVALGSLRRSIGGDRSVSSPNLRQAQEVSYEDIPVLQIDLPRPDLGLPLLDSSLSPPAGPPSPLGSNMLPSAVSGHTAPCSHLEAPSSGFGEHRHLLQQERSPPRPRRDALVKELRLPRPTTEPSFVRSASLGAVVYSSAPTSSHSSLQAQHSDGFTPSPSPSPAINPTDLSTIIEAENSGLSKHIPLDSSQEVSRSFDDDAPGLDVSQNTSNPEFLHATLHKPQSRTSPSKESSVFDLSTSKVTSEVLQAMGGAGPDRTQGWLNGVVVDDRDPHPEPDAFDASGDVGDADVSFNLSELDPDLAALLSPNRLVRADTEPSAQGLVDDLPAPSPRRATPRSPAESPRRPAFSRTPPGSSPPRQPEPLLMPKSRPAPNLPSTAASLPRMNRSVSDRPALQRLNSDSSPASTSRAMSHSPERSVTTVEAPERSLYASRRLLTGTGTIVGDVTGSAPRRSAISRLLGPTRLGPHVTPPSSSRPSSRNSPRLRQDASLSPLPSRPSSAAGLPSRLQTPARSSIDVRSGVRPSFDEGSRSVVTSFRNRKRSLSVVEAGTSPSAYARAHNSRPNAEWLGPQTAKAFAAAGLLDSSYAKDASMNVGRRTPSRLGTTRSSIDDSRSRYVPSRMAFSEAGSVGSWGRGETPSISRRGSMTRTPTLTATMSEVGGPETPRTTFSAASTAPTSVSASSAHMQSELQLLQERHQIETGALLSALADSQRTAKVLREENTQLRDRLVDVEDKLAAAMKEIQALQYAPPPPVQLLSRAPHSRHTSTAAERLNRVGSRSPHKPSSLREYDPPASVRPRTSSEYAHSSTVAGLDASPYFDACHMDKRTSTSSSLFPGPPSNMSMLMHEEDLSAAVSGDREHSAGFRSSPLSASSPTLVLAKLSGPVSMPRREGKVRQEPGNISPTTADFSMDASSPGSLNLRPEHELHLDDMPSFDLNSEHGDDAYDDGDL